MVPLSLLAMPALAVDAAPTESVVLQWDWSQSHRWFIESEVQLPLYMWLQTPFNHQARATAFQIRLVTQCAPGTSSNGKTWEVACTLEDVALSASPMTQDEGKMQEIVTELDDLMTGAVVQLQVRPDGRLNNLDLEGVYRRNQRGGEVVCGGEVEQRGARPDAVDGRVRGPRAQVGADGAGGRGGLRGEREH